MVTPTTQMRTHRAKPGLALLALLLCLCHTPLPAQDLGTLTIRMCLESARLHNRDLIERRQRLSEVDYDRWDLRSRFFPTVSLEGKYNLPDLADLQNNAFRDEAVLRARQRVFEFGADAKEEVDYRSVRRKAVTDYESDVRKVLSQVRRKFYLAGLKRQQIESRRAVLQSVSDKLYKIRVKYERGVAKEFDLLTAQLDSLEQEGQINALLGEQRRLKFDLLRLIGQEMASDVVLSGEMEGFGMEVEAAVDMALARDVEVRRLAEEVGEYGREFRETSLAYLPDVRLQVGLGNGDVVTGLDLTRHAKTRTWQMDVSSDVLLARTGTLPLDARFRERDTNRFAAFDISVPLFAGFQRYGQTGAARARLYQRQTALRDRKDQVERDVRQRHQTLQDRTLLKEIDTRRLGMAQRRLEIQERLRDLGEVTDNQVETFRTSFFLAQERLFATQDAYIAALEDLREVIGYFE